MINHRLIIFSLITLSIILSGCSKQEKPIISELFTAGDRILSHPVLNDGILYFGSNDGNLYAIKAKTGSELWKFQTGFPVKGSVAISNQANTQNIQAGTGSPSSNENSLLYFSSGNNFYALNKEDGQVAWIRSLEFEPTESLDPWDYHHGAPVVHNSEVYFGCEDGNIYCFNRFNGDILFSYPTIDFVPVRCAPTIHNNILYFGDWMGRIYALDLKEQDTIWTYETYTEQPYPTFGQLNTSFSIKDSLLIFGGRNPELQVLNIYTGKLVWNYIEEKGGWISGDPLISGDTLYIGGSDCHKLFAFNVHTGENYWTYEFLYNSFSQPLLIEDGIYFTTGDAYSYHGQNSGRGYLYALNRHSGAIENFTMTGGNALTTPIYHDNKLFFGSDDRILYSIDLVGFLNDPVNLMEKGYRSVDSLTASPNPYQDSTIISFMVMYPAWIQAKITDLNGNEVLTLLDQFLEDGKHSITWDGNDSIGESAAEQFYRISISSGEYYKDLFLQRQP